MASPITVGTVASIVAAVNKIRADIRFQNVGSHDIYLKKIPFSGVFTPPTSTDYEVLLKPSGHESEGGEAFITNSISAFAAVSSSHDGKLAIYETSNK